MSKFLDFAGLKHLCSSLKQYFVSSSGGEVNGDLTVNGTITGDLNGNAESAEKLSSSIKLSLTGGVTSDEVSFDGSETEGIDINVTNVAVNALTQEENEILVLDGGNAN